MARAFASLFVFALLVNASAFAKREVVLRPGEKFTAGDATIKCVAQGEGVTADAPPAAAGVKCDDFHSDDSCRNMPSGTACLKYQKKGSCFVDSNFAGKPNCKCVTE